MVLAVKRSGEADWSPGDGLSQRVEPALEIGRALPPLAGSDLDGVCGEAERLGRLLARLIQLLSPGIVSRPAVLDALRAPLSDASAPLSLQAGGRLPVEILQAELLNGVRQRVREIRLTTLLRLLGALDIPPDDLLADLY